jgi:hypothetical protein
VRRTDRRRCLFIGKQGRDNTIVKKREEGIRSRAQETGRFARRSMEKLLLVNG